MYTFLCNTSELLIDLSWQYNGKMSHQNRDKAIAQFGKKDSNLRIMIASLKCGGIGRKCQVKHSSRRSDRADYYSESDNGLASHVRRSVVQ